MKGCDQRLNLVWMTYTTPIRLCHIETLLNCWGVIQYRYTVYQPNNFLNNFTTVINIHIYYYVSVLPERCDVDEQKRDVLNSTCFHHIGFVIPSNQAYETGKLTEFSQYYLKVFHLELFTPQIPWFTPSMTKVFDQLANKT